MMEVEVIVRSFIGLINSHNVDSLCDLMTEDHKFIDALGTVVEGREVLREAWGTYFRMVPDYHIACEEMMAQGNVLLRSALPAARTVVGVESCWRRTSG